MAIYESMLIFSGRLEAQEVEQEIEKVRNMVESGTGSVHSVERMGRRRLAYDIRKESDGHYAIFHFENDPSRIPTLQKAFRLNEAILRYSVFRREKLPDGPTVATEEEGAHGRDEEDRGHRRGRYDDDRPRRWGDDHDRTRRRGDDDDRPRRRPDDDRPRRRPDDDSPRRPARDVEEKPGRPAGSGGEGET
ncbi:MAG: 30S ribosomal protein S6, partial [Candidatus Eisenbacteria bacterium]